MLVITGVDFSKIYDKVQNLKLSLSKKIKKKLRKLKESFVLLTIPFYNIQSN